MLSHTIPLLISGSLKYTVEFVRRRLEMFGMNAMQGVSQTKLNCKIRLFNTYVRHYQRIILAFWPIKVCIARMRAFFVQSSRIAYNIVAFLVVSENID